MNDDTELLHGFSNVVTIVTRRVLQEQPRARLFAKHLSRFAHGGGIEQSAHYYVCSFTGHGDDKELWAKYAKCGRGYCLAFDSAKLGWSFARAAGSVHMDRLVFPVVYDDRRAAELEERIADVVFARVAATLTQQMKDDVARSYWKALSTILCVYGLGIAAFFKGERRWRHESETRFLEVHPFGKRPSSLKVRPSDRGPTGYVEFNWLSECPAALKHIVVGPNASVEAVQRVLAGVLRDVPLLPSVCARLQP